jgi:hypothetical protein
MHSSNKGGLENMNDCTESKSKFHGFQPTTAEEAKTALTKLQEDSRLSTSEKIDLAKPTLIREAIVSGPAIFAIEATGIAAAAGVAKTLLIEDEITNTVRAKELGRESCALRKNFPQELPEEFQTKTEERCFPSRMQIGLSAAFQIGQGGAYGLTSGLVLAPASDGLTVPVFTVAGALSGVVSSLYQLQRGMRECEVGGMKNRIQSKWDRSQ